MPNFIGLSLKLKRKDLDDVNDDFSEFSLSSPARKIRRLDAELPPIMEDDAEFPLGYEHSVSEGDIEEFPFVYQNEEKAIVPFKPMDDLLIHSNSSYSVDPNLISCFKNQVLLGAHLNPTRPNENDNSRRHGNDQEVNTCRAVIPWIPSSQHHSDQRPAVVSTQPEVLESMDSEAMEVETMEIEESGATNFGQLVSDYINHPTISEGLQQHRQWQQQHCMVPQPPQNITTPIVWYR